MAANFLIDTGAILAILDQNDRWHSVCVNCFTQLRLPAVTSEAVLTETFHLVGRSRTDVNKVWQFFSSGSILLVTIEGSELAAIRELMNRYRDRRMDFADATLVYLASREGIQAVLTIDQTDFSVYRIAGRRRFHVLPADRP